ncbi:hypothetical protein E2C01_100092 [Portunus trituberculatus]|uniref:Uncharacterized protein n=1 Tax=Portunus trituberculatus TaxID=210409 RepID=A0A5B7KC32_PORTR|nr:hypothetical protein [Portunus trituberculatus]
MFKSRRSYNNGNINKTGVVLCYVNPKLTAAAEREAEQWWMPRLHLPASQPALTSASPEGTAGRDDSLPP